MTPLTPKSVSTLWSVSKPDGFAVDAASDFAVFAVMNVNGFEAMMILVVALIVLGPERLPEAARKAGNFINQMKRMSDSFQQEVRDAVDLPDLDVPDLDTLMKPKSAIMKSVLAPPTVVAATPVADEDSETPAAEPDTEGDEDDEANAGDEPLAEADDPDDDGDASSDADASDPFAQAERSTIAAPPAEQTSVDTASVDKASVDIASAEAVPVDAEALADPAPADGDL